MYRLVAMSCWLAAPLLAGSVVFFAAGRWDLPYVWCVLAELTIFSFALAIACPRDLLKERLRPGNGNQDRLTRRLAGLFVFSHWIVAGLDVGRFHWSPMHEGWQVAGVIGYGAALVGVFWAMIANPFYSSAVRIQNDRGQFAVDAGPYRFVRHPGYAATIFAMFAGAVSLGSWLGLLPMLGMVALFIRRTILEDRMLRRELDGYAVYAERVRYRLVAGVF